MTLDLRRSGDALSAAAGELARVWRTARAAARPGCFPGLLDGIIEPFFAVTAEALAEERDPALVWMSLTGVVRVDARDRGRTLDELDAEWDAAEGVFRAACSALDAGDAVTGWISRAVVIARADSRTLLVGRGPRGILVVKVFSALDATLRARARGSR